MAHAQRAHRVGPVELPAEVGDDDDEARLARERPTRPERVGQRVRVVVAVGGDALGQHAAQADEPRAAAARRQQARAAATPTVSSAMRPPRRVARRPTTSATPSATSDFSRSAVPNAIDGETSITSHVVSVRSGTCRRTCGTPVRALAAASSWRTSSPTW